MSRNTALFKSVIANTITIVVILFIGFVIGAKVSGTPSSNNIFASTSSEDVDLHTFWRVWDLLENKYPFDDQKPDQEEKIYGAIQGLTSSYEDPYTIFLEPGEAKLFNEDVGGSFSGVGMEVGVRDGFLVVIAPLKDSPAERAGVRAGDIIIAVDGQAAGEMFLDEAVQNIRGKKGTDVVLNIAREDESEPIDIVVTRDTIIVPTTETEIVGEDIFKINLYSFSANVTRDFEKAIRDFEESSYKKLIVDVRSNPGGFLEAAIDIASFFVPQGKPIVIEDFGDDRSEISYRSKGFPLLAGKDYDMVILMDAGSASASEILAGALSEHDVATLVGDQTFGKGSVQELVPLPDKSSVKITIARWLTPDGNSIEGNGLTPDHAVEMTVEDYENDRDPQLAKAIELLE